MKRLFMLLTCSALLAVTAAAQTSPAPSGEKVLEIHRFNWFEATAPTVDQRDAGYQMAATMKWRQEHAPGRGDYGVMFVLKNVTRKPIKSVNLGFVFRDAETGRVFLTYQTRFDRRISPGEEKKFSHIIKQGQEPDNFSPAAPNAALLDYTKQCGDHTLVFDRKSGELVNRKSRAGEEPVHNVCFAQPAVTRIDYEDGTFWQP